MQRSKQYNIEHWVPYLDKELSNKYLPELKSILWAVTSNSIVVSIYENDIFKEKIEYEYSEDLYKMISPTESTEFENLMRRICDSEF